MRHVLLTTLLALAVVAGCGDSTTVRERDVVLDEPAPAAPGEPRAPQSGGVRIAVITHGQASSAFWAIVRNGIDAARRQVDVVVDYRSPDVYSVARMRELLREAAASKPDALVSSLPSPAIAKEVKEIVESGIDVVTINSGSELSRAAGALIHIGQPEERAAYEAGRRLARAGVRRGLCVNHEVGNGALDVRCNSFARALREAGGSSRVIGIDIKAANKVSALATAMRRPVDGVLALSSDGARAAMDARDRARRPALKLATFDLSPEVLAAVQSGRLQFTIDQQPYLQGYLPIVLLSQRIRYGLFPVPKDVLDTGPNFVTRATAAQAIRLSKQSIR